MLLVFIIYLFVYIMSRDTYYSKSDPCWYPSGRLKVLRDSLRPDLPRLRESESPQR